MKGSTFLKVMSVISLIFGILGLIAGFMSVSSFRLLATFGLTGGLVTASILVVFLGAIFMIIAGAYGIANCRRPEKAGGAVVLGIILVILQVVSIIISFRLVAWVNTFGARMNAVSYSTFTGFIIPVLYILAAVMLKGNRNNNSYNGYAQ